MHTCKQDHSTESTDPLVVHDTYWFSF